MHLLSSLNSGFAGAANGTAKVFIRGSSTRATVYGDFEASTSDSSGADLTLDAYGSREVYVNQLVDVEVYDEDGALVREYTDGYASPNIEVISPAFTGTDYVTAISAVSEPTTVQAVLDRWLTNAGAPDWKVLLNGTATTMLNAFGSLSGLVFNVKSPAYGAVGDGITNDQAAIQAALAAAVAAGGGIVFFPKGTYLVSTAIEWSHLVSAIGVGGDLSVISTSSATNARILTWTTGAASGAVLIQGLGFSSSQSNSGSQLYSSVKVNVVVSQCHLGISATCIGTLVAFADTSFVRILDSKLTGQQANTIVSTASSGSTSVSRTIMRGCHFNTSTNYTGTMLKLAGVVSVNECQFDMSSNVTGATATGIESQNSYDSISITNCGFLETTQPFNGRFVFSATGAQVQLSGNVVPYGVGIHFSGAGRLGDESSLQLRKLTQNESTTTIDDDAEFVTYAGVSTVPTFTMPSKGLYPGRRLTVQLTNSSAGNWVAPTFTGASKNSGVTYPALNVALSGSVTFVYCDPVISGTYVWLAIHAA